MRSWTPSGAGCTAYGFRRRVGLDSLTVLTVAAGRTGRIRLGAGIAYAPLRHPVALAQQALTTAAASGGRFELGTAPGTAR